jgi:23S rRNA pseudouridine1911/1915/1917 synthase
MTLLDRLREEFPHAKRQNLKRMVEARRVLVNGKPASRLDQILNEGDRMIVSPTKKETPRLAFPIVYEDADVLVINKPAGLLTSTVPREPRATALAMVREHVAQKEPGSRVGLIHRLDREASGLLIFSKNNRAFASLKRQFFHHTVTRVYDAVVSPPPDKASGRIESFLRERADGSVYSTRSGGQRAITEFSVTERRGPVALLRVKLHTGRKHQIRAHLSESGFAIIGDELYGGKQSKNGLALTAVELGLDHPRTAKRMKFTIPAKDNPVRALFIDVGAKPGSL